MSLEKAVWKDAERWFGAVADEKGVIQLHNCKTESEVEDKLESYTAPFGSEKAKEHLRLLKTELGEYFSGSRRDFSVLVAPRGTNFQRRVWMVMSNVPFGKTKSYGDIAAIAGSPKGAIAVGQVCKINPVPIVIPCHRILAAHGKLGGFGGGFGPALEEKRSLLRHEGITWKE